MDEPSPHPEILEAHWDVQQVQALFDDLSLGAQVHHVQVRTSAAGRPEDRTTSLAEARELLESNLARAIQIRYTYQDQSWCDTLMVRPESIRVIRTCGSTEDS